MYTVLYQWKIHPDKHDDFISSWEIITDHYLKNHGALGSRLHKASDNTFAAYAQWHSKNHRDLAFSSSTAPEHAVKKMTLSIVERLDPIEMLVISDKLEHCGNAT